MMMNSNRFGAARSSSALAGAAILQGTGLRQPKLFPAGTCRPMPWCSRFRRGARQHQGDPALRNETSTSCSV